MKPVTLCAVLVQIGAFGDPGRDPRGWCVTVAYAALVPSGLDIKAAVSFITNLGRLAKLPSFCQV